MSTNRAAGFAAAALLLVPLAAAADHHEPAAGAKKAAPSPLDGTRWEIAVTPDSATAKRGEKAFDDTLSFADGRLASTACASSGLGAATYSVREAAGSQGVPERRRPGRIWSFTAEAAGEKQGRTSWSGSVDGDRMHGTFAWTKPDGTVLDYTFEGKRAGKR